MYQESKFLHNWLIKKAINDKVRSRLPYLSGRVIDLGCGIRPFENEILEYASEYVGVDWDSTLHELRADIVADLNSSLPVPDTSFDHVVSFEVLEHLREPRTMLAEAFRVLKPKGTITLSAPFMWWVHEAPWDYFRYTRFGHMELLSKAGFINIEVQPTTGFWSMWLLKLNYQTTRLIRGPRGVRLLVRTALIPLWWSTQTIAIWLDRIWPEENETAGYFVTAAKP